MTDVSLTDSAAFVARYGRPPEVVASAPGRVNLIGDHTDYNGGLVLPTALPRRTRVLLARNVDGLVRATSGQVPGAMSYRLGEEARARRWLDYVQGVTQVLLQDRFPIGGFDLHVESDVPVGSGLSSSAALEVSLLRGLRELYGLRLDDTALAMLAHRAETGLVGAPVGVMDQLVCSHGDERSALFIDTRSLALRRVPLPDTLALVVIYSGVDHDLTGGEYGVRRAECEQAAALLGVPLLRDVAEDDPRIATLPGALPQRVRHVLSENARVLAAIEALEARDLPRLGALFDASHRSLRDDYAVSTPEIDLLVELAREHGAVYGARLTGGGFGGSIVIATTPQDAERVALAVARAYASAVRYAPSVVVPRLRDFESRP